MANQRSVKDTLYRISISGVGAALVLIATQFRLPTGIGYVNLGDGVILLFSFLLGPVAFFPAAVGSLLADLLADYPQYMLASFLIKGVMALVAGLILSVPSPSVLRKILAFVLAEAIMVGGYLAFESFLYGFAPACGSLIPNALQGITAIIIGMILSFALRKRRDKKLTGGTRNG